MSDQNNFTEQTVENKTVVRKSILAFVVFIFLLIAGWVTFKWIGNQPQVDGAPKPLRKTLAFNEKVFSALFDTGTLVKEYPVSAAAANVRVNGMYGLRDSVDADWHLNVVRAPGDTLRLTLDDLKKLPKKDVVFNFKCIEGWSQITHWAGVPFTLL